MKDLQFSFGMLDGLAESFYKNVICDKVLPVPGSILKVDLALNPVESMCHTGIYVGHNQIVEMTNDDGTGVIRKVSPKYFLNYSSWRTGVYIYVACVKKDGQYYPLAAPEIAERALEAVGNETKYNLLLDNCHLFVESCITGRQDSLVGTLENIETVLARKFHLSSTFHIPGLNTSSPVYWMSTGVASDDSFPDD